MKRFFSFVVVVVVYLFSSSLRLIRGCDCILFVVDTFDRARIGEAKKELHVLLEQPEVSSFFQNMFIFNLHIQLDFCNFISKRCFKRLHQFEMNFPFFFNTFPSPNIYL